MATSLNKSPTHQSGDTLLLSCRFTPTGHIDITHDDVNAVQTVSANISQQVTDAFARGQGYGVLHLGVAHLSTSLPLSLSFWRDIGKMFVSAVCGALDPTSPLAVVIPEPDGQELEQLKQSVPPVPGAEYIDIDALRNIWRQMGESLTEEAKRFKQGVQAYLQQYSSIWNVVGRVCLHLAENRRNPEYPFAFIATYVHKVSSQAKPQHLPLGRALKEYSGAQNKKKLLELLSPLSRASEKSAFIREMLASKEIYHPLSWTPKEAHHFLSEIPLYEQAGLVVRVPDWWNIHKKPRPKVTVSLGAKPPASLGMNALLDFDIKITLDGKALTKREINELLSAGHGLTLLKGKWVEVSEDQISQVLNQWQALQKRTSEGGISFGEAMRLLAGTSPGTPQIVSTDESPEWSQVIAGKWLSKTITELRTPGQIQQQKINAGLKAVLRPYQRSGVRWLQTLSALSLGGCLADDMGLGKTIQVLGLLNTARERKKSSDLLIVPASLVENWQSECERFAPDLKLLLAHPSHIPSSQLLQLKASDADACDVVITTYGTAMRTPWMSQYNWRYVILDEAQATKIRVPNRPQRSRP